MTRFLKDAKFHVNSRVVSPSWHPAALGRESLVAMLGSPDEVLFNGCHTSRLIIRSREAVPWRL